MIRTGVPPHPCKQELGVTTSRACLHGCGGIQVGEATRLAEVDKKPTFRASLHGGGGTPSG